MNQPLTDAQQMREKYPDTFGAPSKEQIADLTEGSCAKMCVGRERFWVKVATIDKADPDPFRWKFKGPIDNDLVFTDEHGLSCDDSIEFEGRHIYDTMSA